MESVRLRRVWALAVVAILLSARPGLAQSDTGRIEGLVTDSSGAAIPGATVLVTSLSTGVRNTVITDAEGRYTVTGVRAGKYSVHVSLEGFRSAETPEATVRVNQVARFDYRLDTGGVQETVEVVAQTPLLDRVTSSIGTVIDSQQVEELPLNGRNFTQLATLTPGVNRGTPGSSADGSGGQTETFRYGDTGGAALSVNGVREQFNNYMLDGVDNNESLVNSVSIFPPVEGIQEFRVTTSGAGAEFGRAGGAVINVITKGGGNRFSGSLYEFFRDDSLDSTPAFQDVKLSFRRNQFGGSLGGPILRNRTFFFGEYQGLRETLPTNVGSRVTVPTARMRNGDFSELLDANFTGVGAPIIIFNPQTGQPFPGNIIPSGMLNQTAVNYLNFYPLPDFTDRAQRNYSSRRERDSKFHNGTGRIDHVISQADNLFGRFSYGREKRFDPGFIPGAQAGFGSGSANNETFGMALGYNRVFTPAWVAETRFGWNRQQYEFLPVGWGTNLNAELGIGGPGGINGANGISLIGGGDGRYIEYLGDFGQYIVPQRTWHLSGSVTHLRGPHTLKAGASVIRRKLSSERSNFGKGFYFFSDCLATPSEIAGGRCGGSLGTVDNTGYEVANMLIGVTNFTITGFPEFPRRDTFSWENSIYLQDDWQVNERLTLNLGLRYDVFTPYYEGEDRLANFDRETGLLVFGGQDGASRSTIETDWNNVGPRAGFAYQVNARTVVRGAYGLFFTLDRGGIDNQLTENPPFNLSQFRGADAGGAVRLDQQIILPPRPDPTNRTRTSSDLVLSAWPENTTNHVHQFNVSLQRELAPRVAVLAAYIGTRGRDLTTVYSAPGLDNVRFIDNIGRSDYNSLQLQVRQLEWKGLTYLASYTLSKAENDSPGLFPGPLGSIQGTVPGLDDGAADYDRRHQFSLAATYALPFYRNEPGVKGALLGGWQANWIVTLQSGTPFNVFCDGRRAAVSGDWEGPETTAEWFNTAAFSCAASFAEGHERNLLYSPGYKALDMSLFKTFGMVDTHEVELRFEVFNLFNTVQYSAPNNQLGSAEFGRITSARLNTQRQIQLGVRYTF